MELFEAVERLGPVRLIKASFFAYPVINALHIASIGTLFSSVLLLDLAVLGLLRPPGGREFFGLMRKVALTAFAGALLTGAVLFSVRASEYAAMTVFQAKLALILLAGFNLLLFTRLERQGSSGGQRLSATASLILWGGALLCGRFIGFL